MKSQALSRSRLSLPAPAASQNCRTPASCQLSSHESRVLGLVTINLSRPRDADAQHGRLPGVGAELQRAQASAPAAKINSCRGGVWGSRVAGEGTLGQELADSGTVRSRLRVTLRGSAAHAASPTAQ